MDHVNIIKHDLEVAWDKRTLISITWIPYGDPNERPRVSIFEYYRGHRRLEAIVIVPLSHTWADTREPVSDPSEWRREVREYAIDKAYVELEVDEEDWRLNDEALMTGGRLLSAYTTRRGGTRLWVITEAQDDQGRRASTCVLLPSEY